MSLCLPNTSPLVFLCNLGRLELLRHNREVCIPPTVANESSREKTILRLEEVTCSA